MVNSRVTYRIMTAANNYEKAQALKTPYHGYVAHKYVNGKVEVFGNNDTPVPYSVEEVKDIVTKYYDKKETKKAFAELKDSGSTNYSFTLEKPITKKDGTNDKHRCHFNIDVPSAFAKQNPEYIEQLDSLTDKVQNLRVRQGAKKLLYAVMLAAGLSAGFKVLDYATEKAAMADAIETRQELNELEEMNHSRGLLMPYEQDNYTLVDGRLVDKASYEEAQAQRQAEEQAEADYINSIRDSHRDNEGPEPSRSYHH